MENEKGQVETKQPEATYEEGFDSKWDEMMETAKTPTAEPTKADAKKDEECPECEKEKRAKEEAAKSATPTAQPYKVLKVQGRDHPVKDEAELIALAQMGVDYTKKTQGLSDERKKWEGEFQTKHDELETLADKFNKMFAGMKAGDITPETTGQARPTANQPASLDSIYKQYGIDPEFAEPYQKKMIEDLYNTNKRLSSYDEEIGNIKKITNLMILKETTTKVGEIIKDERSKHPFDEIMSEDGTQNLTQKQFMAVMMAKENEAKAQGRQINLEELARETVRDVSQMQNRAKANASPDVSKSLTPDEFAKAYPDLYSKILEKAKGNAVAEYEADKAKVPPSLESKKREVDLSKVSTTGRKLDTPEDFIDDGFDKIDMKELLGLDT
ncbi:MAG: hypothetical protein WC455_17960 [Dehalococcoidia bacterium]|jgi:hypothetical protein